MRKIKKKNLKKASKKNTLYLINYNNKIAMNKKLNKSK